MIKCKEPKADLYQEVIKDCYLVYKYGLPKTTVTNKGMRCDGFPKSYYDDELCEKCKICGANISHLKV